MPRHAALLFVIPLTAICNPPPSPPAFDAADIHASPRADWVKDTRHPMQGGFLAADRYQLHRATMLDMLKLAYNVDAAKIYGGPSWLDYDRFEVDAKTKPGTRPETLQLMLQTLLADRFHLAVKEENRDVPGYILSKGKHELKLKNAAGAAPCQFQTSMTGADANSVLRCGSVNMDQLANSLRRVVSGLLGSLPVVNATGLEGTWEIEIQYPARSSAEGRADAGVIDSLDRLGLKLEAGKVPQPVLVVESVNELPSANPTGLAALLPALPPPAFEVAAVKWPCEGDRSMAPRFEAGGRVTAMCLSPVTLIKQAWNLANFEDPVGVPKSLSQGTAANISIVAKAPAGVAPDPQHNLQARDVLNQMLRALLIDRYKIQFHYEQRPMDAYTLVAAKPKLTKADPAGRTGCARESQEQQGRVLMVKLVCHNITMAQFAEQLPAYESGIVYPVIDESGLTAAWDFSIRFDAMANLYARFPQFGAKPDSANGDAADPSGSITFADAVEKQLGLKLETRKRPVPVLVIDRIEEKPAEN